MSQKTAPERLGNVPIQRDLGFHALVGLLGLVAVWLLSMPLVPAVAEATMDRFHLTTESFPLWAIQQPIPSMYNFDNRVEVQQRSLGLYGADSYETIKSCQTNHFPARLITFADTRGKYLEERCDRWFTLITSYRGIEKRSRYHLKPTEEGGFEMIRLEGESTDE